MFKTGFQDESIAYALAAGLVTCDTLDSADREIERNRRRQRRDRLRRGEIRHAYDYNSVQHVRNVAMLDALVEFDQ